MTDDPGDLLVVVFAFFMFVSTCILAALLAYALAMAAGWDPPADLVRFMNS